MNNGEGGVNRNVNANPNLNLNLNFKLNLNKNVQNYWQTVEAAASAVVLTGSQVGGGEWEGKAASLCDCVASLSIGCGGLLNCRH